VDLREHAKALIGLSLVVIIISSFLAWYFVFNQPSYVIKSYLWKQTNVYGLDNFATATYKDGVLYAPSKGDNKVYALNANDGSIIWSSQVRQCDGSPYIDTAMIYVGECSEPDGSHITAPKAMALNRSSGQVLWSFTEPDGAEWVGSPVVNGEFVYYTTLGTGIYALNKTNGNPIWHRNIGKVVCSVAYDNGVIFVSANDPPGQYAFNATNGEKVWNQSFGSSWDSSPVIYQGMVIQVAGNATRREVSTYVLNKTTGQLINVFSQRGGQSTPLVHDGTIFIPSENCQIYAYNLLTGTELWHTSQLTRNSPTYLQRPELSYCSPALTGGTIYYQSLDGVFYAIDETTGRISWTCQLGDPTSIPYFGFGSPSIGGGRVYITNDAALYAFEIGSMNTEWPMFCRNNLHQSSVD
jgi:outer membrane protein assembly factor BamB